jgi:hypothetical protein
MTWSAFKNNEEVLSVNNRRKTGIILLIFSIVMFSPFLMNLVWIQNPLFQNLGFSRGEVAPLYSWSLALLVSLSYVIYTFRTIPLVWKMQREITLLKFIGIVSAFASGLLEEVVFRRWLMDFTMNIGYGVALQVMLSGLIFGLAQAV